ncbi:hypothetical protein P8H27_13800 [Pseudomonas sp. sp1636]|uniref:hypothetical protein n=1 Tax=Pseudomonas sp. sp1636 TaxID=3036707 RepID=UPI0025A5CEB1|nr:hypothetical protein [Pseudomonas sp. sp1636]MDM8349959.1 hypothetical protein [Pseudomonas sp. sp1636]
MSSDSRETSDDSLSDEQRLTALENNRRRDRILLGLLAGLLTVMLASWLTWGLMSLFAEEQDTLDNSQVETLRIQQSSLEKQVAGLKLELANLGAKFSSTPALPAPNSDNRASLEHLARLLQAQELGFQQSLAALKNGMRDLAGMIAGSRSWLDDYNEALDKELAASQARLSKLQQWASGKQPEPAVSSP